MNFTWKIKRGLYQSGQALYLNRIRVGGYGWNAFLPRGSHDDSKRWQGEVSLPSLKTKDIFSFGEEIIRAKIEGVVSDWFKEALAHSKGSRE